MLGRVCSFTAENAGASRVVKQALLRDSKHYKTHFSVLRGLAKLVMTTSLLNKTAVHLANAGERILMRACLHDNGLGGVVGRNELEVLDGRQLYAAAEVEAPAAQALVPVRRLVAQLHAMQPTHSLQHQGQSVNVGTVS